jgi:hypothetical protein
MPMLKPKPPPPDHWNLVFGAATGENSRDFYVLGYSPDLDEFEIRTNPLHQEFTHIFHFKDFNRQLVVRVNERVDDIWRSPSGQVYAVGSPRGILEITAASCTEVSIPNIPGTFSAIWGTNDDHIFACGTHATFLLYRRFGSWTQIPLPTGINSLRDIAGFNERDVYIVGDNGQILHFDGRHFYQLDSPTTRHLTCITPLDETNLCIGGYGGVLLFGNIKGWRFISTGTSEPILNLGRFEGRVCFGTPDGVWSFNGKTAPSLLVRQRAHWVNSLGDTIMIVDGYDSWLFDSHRLFKLDTVL